MNACRAFAVGRFGPRVNPAGAQVTFAMRPWDVLGAVYCDGPPAGWYLTLRTFDKRKTVLAPMSACEVLERTYIRVVDA